MVLLTKVFLFIQFPASPPIDTLLILCYLIGSSLEVFPPLNKPTGIERSLKVMPMIQFKSSDRFSCKLEGKVGVGIVLADQSTFVILGEGGRSGYEARKTERVPDGAMPLATIPAHEITFALDCVALSHDLQPTTARF